LGPVGAYGFVLAIVLIAGLALVSGQRRTADQRAELAVPVALLAGALVLLLVTAVNRPLTLTPGSQSRYVSLVGAMLLPALAVAADALKRRWHWFLTIAIALFLLGIPANVHAATHAQKRLRARDLATRLTMLSLPNDPRAGTVPRAVRPEPLTAYAVTIGWLLDAERDGKLPRAPVPSSTLQASNRFRLSFVQTRGPVPEANCRTTRRSFVTELHQGDRIGVHDDALFLEPERSKLVGLHLYFEPTDGEAITVLRDAGPTRVTAVPGSTLRMCVDRG
jgi:hypothetical protein